MGDLRSINTQSKNSMPTFVHTSYNNLVRGLSDKKVQPPIFGFLSDLECMVYVDHDGHIYKILVDRITEVEKQLEGLKDPETGQPVSVVEYVQPTIEAVEEIQKNGATILITSDGGEE